MSTVRMLDGKVAIVTGGSSGIGLACVERCLKEGAAVSVGDIQAGAATGQPSDRLAYLRTDVSSSTDVAALVEATLSHFGRLDILIAAAGISGGTGETAEYSEADFDRVIAVDLKGVFLSMRFAIAAMLRSGGGAIVNIASVCGLVGLPRTPGYSAAKAGVIQLTKVAALEYATRGIRVNCLCPGMVDTPMVQSIPLAAQQHFISRQPIGRLGSADEIAATAVFLASDAATFITGAAIAIDGGYTAQ